MTASHDLAHILEEWLQLTQQESAAIQTSHWLAIKRIHSRKAALREALALAGRDQPITDSLRAEAGRIISLLARNGEALAAQLGRTRARQKQLDEAKRNVRRIQQSYLPPRPTAWQSYS